MNTLASNINVRHRLTQVIILVACVMLCMLISQFAVAGRNPKPPRFDKYKFRVNVHINSNRVVKVLYKKRMEAPKSSLLASNRRSRGKAQVAQAETDSSY